MKRTELSGFPFEVTKEGNITTLRFYPKPTAQYPNQAVLTLKLTEKDKQTLKEIL